jgi:hypothetical protein
LTISSFDMRLRSAFDSGIVDSEQRGKLWRLRR